MDVPLALQSVKRSVYYGTFVHTPKLDQLDILHNTAIGVDLEGTIQFIKEFPLGASTKTVLEYAESQFGTSDLSLVDYSDKNNCFFFPGFIDTHIHAPQFPNNGIFGSTTLLEWLETYTFPLESSFKKLDIAREIYSKVVNRTLKNGTTMAAYYATIHTDATNLLCDIALELGQRALIGKVCMNQHAPDHYLETLESCQKSTLKVIDHVHSRDPQGELVAPVLTPRFAGSCTQDLLEWIGELRAKYDYYVQTHLSENHSEIEWIGGLFPHFDHYTDIYQKTNLLGHKTILAHCIHLSDEEMQILKKTESGVSHCPTSNSSITSGEARIRWLLDNDIKVSLGTDCSGGFTPSILEVCKHALLVSRHLVMKNQNNEDKLSAADVLYLGTLGGANVLGLNDKLGSFEVGKKWDVQLIDLESPGSNVDTFYFQEPQWGEEESSFSRKKLGDLIDKWLFNGDDRNVLKVWVNGRLVINN